MPYYKPIKNISGKAEKKRLVNNLLRLREQLRKDIPEKTATRTLLLATWNIREFKSGARLEESYYYLAEIIARFDLVAVQEVANDLTALQKLLFHLGHNWNYIVTDSTEGPSGGMERIAFLYDTNKVQFSRIAGEIVLPRKALIDGEEQFARTPFTVAFQAGWFKFMLTSVHIFFGKEKGPDFERRVKEIETVSGFLAKRAKKEGNSYILLGDFNITDTDDKTFDALCSGGFLVPEELRLSSNMQKNKHYDQIAFKVKEGPGMTIFPEDGQKAKAGVFDCFEVLFTEEDLATYRKYFDEKNVNGKTEQQIKNYYLSKYRTFQLSDHLPLWVELQIDFSDQYLKSTLEEKKQEKAEQVEESILTNVNKLSKRLSLA